MLIAMGIEWIVSVQVILFVVIYSYSMHIMLEHNNGAYICFLKALVTLKVNWLCCCYRGIVEEQLATLCHPVMTKKQRSAMVTVVSAGSQGDEGINVNGMELSIETRTVVHEESRDWHYLCWVCRELAFLCGNTLTVTAIDNDFLSVNVIHNCSRIYARRTKWSSKLSNSSTGRKSTSIFQWCERCFWKSDFGWNDIHYRITILCHGTKGELLSLGLYLCTFHHHLHSHWVTLIVILGTSHTMSFPLIDNAFPAHHDILFVIVIAASVIGLIIQLLIGVLVYRKLRHYPKTHQKFKIMFVICVLCACCITLAALVENVLQLMSLPAYQFAYYAAWFFLFIFFGTLLATVEFVC